MKLGFIVEGDVHKAVVEAVARQLLPARVRFHTVRLGGKAALSSAYTTVLMFLARRFDHVFIFFDTDTSLPEEVAEQEARVEDSMRRHHFQDGVTVVPVVPDIESWLAAGLRGVAGPTMKSPSSNGRTDNISTVLPLVKKLDLKLLRRNSANFAKFADHLEAVVSMTVAR